MGAPDHRQPETLRSLAAAQRLPGRDRRHHPVGHFDDGVGRRDHHAESLGTGEAGDAVRDDPLIDQGACGVVEEHVAVAVGAVADVPAEQVDRLPGRPRPVSAACDDVAHLAIGSVQDSFRLADELGWHHDDDLVDAGSGAERRDAVLEQRPPGEQLQLLRCIPADPDAGAAGQHNGHCPHDRTLSRRTAAARPGVARSTPARAGRSRERGPLPLPPRERRGRHVVVPATARCPHCGLTVAGPRPGPQSGGRTLPIRPRNVAPESVWVL